MAGHELINSFIMECQFNAIVERVAPRGFYRLKTPVAGAGGAGRHCEG